MPVFKQQFDCILRGSIHEVYTNDMLTKDCLGP